MRTRHKAAICGIPRVSGMSAWMRLATARSGAAGRQTGAAPRQKPQDCGCRAAGLLGLAPPPRAPRAATGPEILPRPPGFLRMLFSGPSALPSTAEDILPLVQGIAFVGVLAQAYFKGNVNIPDGLFDVYCDLLHYQPFALDHS